MLTGFLTFVPMFLLAKWASGAVPNSRWYTAAIILATMIASPIFGFGVGVFLAFVFQQNAPIAPQEYFVSGLVWGTVTMTMMPLVVWYSRRQKKRGSVQAQVPVRSAFDALRR